MRVSYLEEVVTLKVEGLSLRGPRRKVLTNFLPA
jgi:hypothetical protein